MERNFAGTKYLLCSLLNGFRLVGKLAIAGTDEKKLWKNIKEIRKVELKIRNKNKFLVWCFQESIRDDSV